MCGKDQEDYLMKYSDGSKALDNVDRLFFS